MKINSDLTKILKKEHEEKWIALNKQQTKIIDFSTHLVDLKGRLGENGKKVVYMKVPRSDTIYAF